MLDPAWESAPLRTARLQTAVSTAYSVFGRYPLHAPLLVCRCNSCVSDQDAHDLLTTPLHTISSALLAEYTNSAHGYDFEGIETQFKYLLPRYLELIALGEPPHQHSSSITLSRLGDARYRERWRQTEIEAIDEFFAGLVDAFLGRLPFRQNFWPKAGFFDFFSVIDLIVNSRGDIQTTLEIWEAHADPIAALYAAYARARLIRHDGEGWVYQAMFYNHSEDGYYQAVARRLAEWMLSERWTKRIEAAFFLTPCEDEQAILSEALG